MNKNPETKAIIFDFVGVLFLVRKGVGVDKKILEIDQLIGSCIDDRELILDIKNIYGIEGKELDELAKKIAYQFEPNTEIWQAIPDLAKRYKLAIINNGASLALPYFKKQAPIDKYFPLFLCSGQLGFKKPDAKIYQLALERLNCSANECIFIDDYQENVDGGNAIGIKSMLWTEDSKIQEILNLIEN